MTPRGGSPLTEDLLRESENLRQRLIAAVDRLDGYVTLLRREVDARLEGRDGDA